MTKAYTDKSQFNEQANYNIAKIEILLKEEYKRLLNEGYNIIEISDMINHANSLQRGKFTWDNL